MGHFLKNLKNMIWGFTYIKDSADVNAKNEFTKTFCEQAEYQINKKVHEVTVDRNYKAGANEAVETMKE